MKTSRIFVLPALLLAAHCSSSSQSASPGDLADSGAPDGGGVVGEGGGAQDGSTKPKALTAPSHGSTVAISVDDTRVVMVNHDVGTVTVFAVDYASDVLPALTKLAEIQVGGEPSSVVIHPNGTQAFVVVRKDQKVVRIDDLMGTPTKGMEIAVGSEPTGIAMEPTGATVWVTSWVDGTIASIATDTMAISSTIDLNATLAASGYLGTVAARPALAHPRAIAITNNGDLIDKDESILVTDYYAFQKVPLAPDGSNVGTAKVGVVYKIPLATKTPSIVELPPMADIGYHDLADNVVGCYPNQLGSMVIQGGFGYVNSVCASSRGPTGLSFGPAAATCAADATCPGAGVGSCVNTKCKTNCTADAQCGANGGKCTNNVCDPNPANVKKLTAPIVSIIDLGAGKTIATVNLAKEFSTYYDGASIPDDATRRMPLLSYDIGFVPGTVTAYFPAAGTDAVFKVDFDATYAASTIDSVADPKAPFINLAPAGIDPSRMGRMPTGIAVANKTHTTGSTTRYAFVANEATRTLSVIDLANQEVAGVSSGTPVALPSAAMPTDATEAASLEGKRLFTTGLGRWSWKGQGWLACTSCHADGLSDNVTWYLGGPAQSPSLEGSYASGDPTDYRINLWRAKIDEPTDHEGAIRSIAGGVGAIVSDAALAWASRITTPPSLSGSSVAISDPANPAGLPAACVLDDWQKIMIWMRTVRSPRRPSNLDAQKVSAGKDLFQQANCQGCHSGPKWTISKVFYTPDPTGTTNTKLTQTSWSAAVAAAAFPTALLPAVTPAMQTMRYAGTTPALDQLTCMLRPVGTFGVAEPGAGVLEVKGSDMLSIAQGDEPDGRGFNTPSLLGMAMGAPYFHAGQARTLEAALSETFSTHLRALGPSFLDPNDPARADKVGSLIQYVLSIDEDEAPLPIPALGPSGGSFCTAP